MTFKGNVIKASIDKVKGTENTEKIGEHGSFHPLWEVREDLKQGGRQMILTRGRHIKQPGKSLERPGHVYMGGPGRRCVYHKTLPNNTGSFRQVPTQRV